MAEEQSASKLRTEVVSVRDKMGKEDIPFFPDHAISEATTIFLVLCLISFLCIFFPAGLESIADPMRTPAGAKPEWYFLFLYAFLRLVPPIVGVLAPIVGVVFLFLLPFLDKNPKRALRKRVLAISFCIFFLALIVVLTIMGYLAE